MAAAVKYKTGLIRLNEKERLRRKTNLLTILKTFHVLSCWRLASSTYKVIAEFGRKIQLTDIECLNVFNTKVLNGYTH